MDASVKSWSRCRVISVAVLLIPACTNQGITARPPAPDEAVWTIRCATLRGPDRYRQAEACATALKHVAGLKAERLQVINTDEDSVVYYGWYRRSYDSATGKPRYTPDYLPDLELIRSLSLNGAGGRVSFPFVYATIEELPTARSPHPEWDLTNADGHWSLHVAVFYNDENISNRRYLAEAYCAELREQGVEAYYHHGPANSSVCVGLFPKQAVQTIMQKDPWSGAVQATNRIVDERLLALQRRFPESYQNGQRISEIVRDPKTGEIKERIPAASFLILVPRAEKAERGRSGG